MARGNEVFNLRRRSNMSTPTKTRETWNSGNILPGRAALISPRVQICALLRALCAHTSSRTRAAKTPVIARILQRLLAAFFSSSPFAPNCFLLPDQLANSCENVHALRAILNRQLSGAFLENLKNSRQNIIKIFSITSTSLLTPYSRKLLFYNPAFIFTILFDFTFVFQKYCAWMPIVFI